MQSGSANRSRKLGLLGGLGPEATADYYQRITSRLQQLSGGLSIPEFVIYSADIGELFRLAHDEDWDGVTDWLLERITALAEAGADFAAISAITPHVVFDRVAAKSPLPLISIVTATVNHACVLGVSRIGLLGTAFTMQSGLFDAPLAAVGIDTVVPTPDEQLYIQERLESEVERGVFTAETRHGLVGVIDRLQREDDVEAVLLGCTELPLVLDQGDVTLPLLIPSAIHVEAIIDYWCQ